MRVETIDLEKGVLPLLPLRDLVVFPGAIMSLFVGRRSSMQAIEQAVETHNHLLLLSQKNAKEDEPSLENLYHTGVVAQIVQATKLKDGTYKLIIEGLGRAQAENFTKSQEGLWLCAYRGLASQGAEAQDLAGHARVLRADLTSYAKLNKRISAELLTSLEEEVSEERLADRVAMALDIPLAEKQALLETVDLLARFKSVIRHLHAFLEQAELDHKLNRLVKEKMDKTQKDYYLQEKIRQIRKELDQDDELAVDEIHALKARIEGAQMPPEVLEKAQLELRKLNAMSSHSPDASVVRNYIDWLLDVPWHQRSRISKNLERAEKILNEEHFGLEKVKERILEFLAVQQKVGKVKGPVLCLVGPPGVGKTSLAQSMAKATGRKYIRMALGGVRDEAEIRGHRRTYLGAMPGKIVQRMAKVGVKNPLFLLDEIDKMSSDLRGDPSSALLEVLDPEQNKAFNDHYLDVDYDLSEVLFVATSNSMDMPLPLVDRMEVIRIAGYTEAEKLAIARNHLLPKTLKEHGLKAEDVVLSDEALRHMIRTYTKEAGVRELTRNLAKLARKVVKAQLLNRVSLPLTIDINDWVDYLGVEVYRFGLAGSQPQIGKVTGLAWTQLGGELLSIEAVKMPGSGHLKLTGKLGEVMQESAQTAWSWVRSHSSELGLAIDFYEKIDVHLHVPEGATPKDGPSAGIAMVTVLVSLLTDTPVKNTLAMTGEVTLLGEVLPIGGLKEKLLAAVRGGIEVVLIPWGNQKDLRDLPPEITKNLRICLVRWVDEVLKDGLEYLGQTADMALLDASASRETDGLSKIH